VSPLDGVVLAFGEIRDRRCLNGHRLDRFDRPFGEWEFALGDALGARELLGCWGERKLDASTQRSIRADSLRSAS